MATPPRQPPAPPAAPPAAQPQQPRGQMGGRGRYFLPTTHQGGMAVPKGGSSCLTCRFYAAHPNTPYGICRNQLWVTWNGNDPRIPCAADSYCSDWYESRVALPPCPPLR